MTWSRLFNICEYLTPHTSHLTPHTSHKPHKVYYYNKRTGKSQIEHPLEGETDLCHVTCDV